LAQRPTIRANELLGDGLENCKNLSCANTPVAQMPAAAEVPRDLTVSAKRNAFEILMTNNSKLPIIRSEEKGADDIQYDKHKRSETNKPSGFAASASAILMP